MTKTEKENYIEKLHILCDETLDHHLDSTHIIYDKIIFLIKEYIKNDPEFKSKKQIRELDKLIYFIKNSMHFSIESRKLISNLIENNKVNHAD